MGKKHKKRGRPPKEDNSSENEEKSPLNPEQQESDTLPKKRRGRPPKRSLEEQQDEKPKKPARKESSESDQEVKVRVKRTKKQTPLPEYIPVKAGQALQQDIQRDLEKLDKGNFSDGDAEESLRERENLLEEMDELHELLRRDDPNQPVRRHPRIEERKRKKHYNSVNKEKIQLVVGSPEYHGFIEHLQEVEDDPNYCVCLSCWRFVNLHQKRLHQFKGHETIPNGTITSESSFLHYNQLFQNLPTRKIVTLIQPLSLTEGSSREDLTNHLCSDLRFGSNFTGFTKGQPPYLNEPVCPFNLISSQFDPSGTHEEVQQELEMLGWYKRAKDTALGKECGMLGQLKFGQFVNGYGKEVSLMFMRMIEEAWLDVEATQGIMGEIGHMIREIRVRQGQRQYDII